MMMMQWLVDSGKPNVWPQASVAAVARSCNLESSKSLMMMMMVMVMMMKMYDGGDDDDNV